MTEHLSNCCKASATVSSSDEGTSCFMCSECNRPCDLFCASVDDLLNDIDEFIVAYSVCNSMLSHVKIIRSEYENLKRLDENIKQRIEKLEQANSPCHETLLELEILKRLYDENTQENQE